MAGAEPGDLIVYDWYGQGIANPDHIAIITGLAQGDYPEVSEMGQNNWVGPRGWIDSAIAHIDPFNSTYTQRGWTWSQQHHEWLQKEFPRVQAFLIHINGGTLVPTF